jgi:hypothetical protein
MGREEGMGAVTMAWVRVSPEGEKVVGLRMDWVERRRPGTSVSELEGPGE